MKALEKLPDLLAARDWRAAEAVLKRAAAMRGAPASVFYNLGRVLMEQANWPPARHWLRKALETDPRHQAAWFELGRTLLALQDLPAAAAAFERAVNLDPADADARRNLGRIALRLGRFETARAALLPLDGQDIETDCALYRIAAETGDPEAPLRRRALLARADRRALVLKALTRTAKGALPLNL